MTSKLLSIADHDRNAAGMTYVYPVVSRRAGGLSVGINLNPNNACNWRCIYCQVPDLVRGKAPPIDIGQLQAELRYMLQQIVQGDYLQQHVPEGVRRLNDIAFSGNGEPTSVGNFAEVVEAVVAVMREFELDGKIRLVLITNGSQAERRHVREGLAVMAAHGGEVWFKMDRATVAGMQQVNSVHVDPAAHMRRLLTVAAICPVWVQSCWFVLDGCVPDEVEQLSYLRWLRQAAEGAGTNLRGVLLYGIARPSMQPEAVRLATLPPEWLNVLAERIRQQGLAVRVSP